MDALIVAGLSKMKGTQYSMEHDAALVRDGMPMTYTNLRKVFGVPADRAFDNFSTPYLAGIYLYHYLTRRGHACGLVNFLDLELDRFKRMLRESPPVIAISTTFMTSIRLVDGIVKQIRQLAPDAIVILGGQLVYNSYLLHQMKETGYDTESCRQDYYFLDPAFCHEGVDLFVVEEQGEKTFHRVLTAIREGKDYATLPNLAYVKERKVVFTAREKEDNDFAEDLVEWDDAAREYLAPIFPLRGSRGCPYRCEYCNFAPCRDFRIKTPEILEREVDALTRTGRVRMIRFTDDNLFLTKKHVEQYCRKLLDVGRGVKWTSFIRANSVSEENVGLLKESGCLLAQIGMESGDPEMLKRMNKKDTPDNYRRVIELLNGHGISTQLYFIVGFPGETERSVDNTVNLLNGFAHEGPAINELVVFPFLLMPLSPIYKPEERAKYGLQGHMGRWSHATMDVERARTIAREVYFRVEHVHHPYGMEEFEMVEIGRLKRIYELRSAIRRAEVRGNDRSEIDRCWGELCDVVRGADEGGENGR